MLLIHGARAVLAAASKMKQPDPVRRWALALAARVGHNKATVALASKLARYAWAVYFYDVLLARFDERDRKLHA